MPEEEAGTDTRSQSSSRRFKSQWKRSWLRCRRKASTRPTPIPSARIIETANVAAYEQGLLGDVYFDFDKYELKPEARERLAKNADFLRAHPEFEMLIEGHCDERGTAEYNLALGDRRANAAKNYLMSLGIPAGPIQIVSFGEERPQCQETSEACWWRNRRAHFVIRGRH